MIQKKRIVFYSCIRGEWLWGAPDYVWHQAAAALLEQGHQVLVIHPAIQNQQQELLQLKKLGAEVIETPDIIYSHGWIAEWKRKVANFKGKNRTVLKRLQSFHPDLFFINQGGCFDLVFEAVLVDFLSREAAPYVLFCRLNQDQNPYPRNLRDDIKHWMGNAKAVLFNSKWTRQMAEKQLLYKIPNADYFPHIIRFDYEQKVKWPKKKRIQLAAVSRLDVYHKGLDQLLVGLSYLLQQHQEWDLNIYGAGSGNEYLEEMIDFLKLNKHVHLIGRTNDIKKVWQENHMLVLTSRYEGLAVSMLEAMACGRPVLRTPYGGCEEWIEDGKNGFICPAPEPELISKALSRAFQSYEDWEKFGTAAFEKIKKNLDPNPEKIYFRFLEN